MKTFIFQTGHGKGLAKAELDAVLKGGFLDEVFDGLVYEAEINHADILQDHLGGTIRIAEVLQKAPAHMPVNFVQWVTDAVTNEVQNTKGKVRFGLSMHPKSDKNLKKILNDSKKNLKQEVGNIRFVNKDFQNLSSAQAFHENLISDQSIELHLFESEKYWYLAKTLSIQNIEWYSHRDMNRPARDPKTGMFPPKLAQMLINLAQPTNTVYDPFCGSGTVLQEAWLIGHTVRGSDLEPRLVEDSIQNLAWLKNVAELPEATPHVFPADARTLTTDDLPTEPFVIVTETWLGPVLHAPPTPDELKAIQHEVESLYEDFFKNLKSIVKGPVTVVFTAPFHREKNERHFLPRLPEILAKYTQILPLSEHERPSLFYERKDQLVGREIWKVLIA